MRIATWNVNGLRARLEFVRLWLRERQPDVVALQELKATDEAFPAAALEEDGYRAIVAGQKAWNGVAILTREPARLVQRGLPGQEEMGSRLVTAEVGASEGADGLLVTSVYVPNGKTLEHEDYGRKLAWLDAVAEHLQPLARDGRPAIVGGDFNVCPAPLDSWDEARFAGSIFHTDAERARMARLREDGWHDLFREARPDAQEFSWWDYRAGAFPRGHGLRIDFLLGTAAVAERVRSVEIDRDWRKKHDGLVASDHAPVVVELG